MRESVAVGEYLTPIGAYLVDVESYKLARPELKAAFAEAMRRHRYSPQETRNAFLWFVAGWMDRQEYRPCQSSVA